MLEVLPRSSDQSAACFPPTVPRLWWDKLNVTSLKLLRDRADPEFGEPGWDIAYGDPSELQKRTFTMPAVKFNETRCQTARN